MTEPVTRVTLFVPGPTAIRKAELGKGVDAEWIDNDGQFGKAFSFGTVEPETVARIDAAPGALVLRCTADLGEGREQIVAVVKRLRKARAIAVRLEQSKLGWDIARWLELFSADDPWSWHRGAIAFLRGTGTMQSCGMHAFSLPDVRVDVGRSDPGALQELASLLNVYQLAEAPVIRSGQTFAPDPSKRRRVLERWPDTEYPPDHACHNPYGVWRVGAAGGKARKLSELVPVFTPALAVLLAALEDRAGKPLTKKQVEAARDKAVCVAMTPGDARQLERSRGYGDLDPELAWEQWQLVRNNK